MIGHSLGGKGNKSTAGQRCRRHTYESPASEHGPHGSREAYPRARHSQFWLLRQREGHQDAARGCGRLSSTGGDHDVLPAVHLESGGGCISGRGERGLPQKLARRLVQRAKDLVIAGGGDKQQTTSRHNRATVVLAARAGNSLSPSGIFHTVLPLFRSIAVKVPHGG